MKKKLSIVAAILLVLQSVFSFSAQAEESQVVVSASGVVSVKPDVADFIVEIKSDAKSADKAAADTAEKYQAVQSALRQAGVASGDAVTAGFTVSPKWEWQQSTAKNVLNGYSARHSIKVKVRSLGSIGKVIDAVVQSGGDEVQNIAFSSSRYDSLRHEALSIAVGNARRDGEIMARAAGGRLGQLIEVSVGQPSYRERPYMEAVAMKAAPSPASTELAPADQEISVTINSRWRFIPAPAK
ncbi:MAG: SIMPL domain-containing protein [Chlorobiaceae bacterium]|nr:SIMPL domain-containing protein [Chlorobiaceae bacterium]